MEQEPFNPLSDMFDSCGYIPPSIGRTGSAGLYIYSMVQSWTRFLSQSHWGYCQPFPPHLAEFPCRAPQFSSWLEFRKDGHVGVAAAVLLRPWERNNLR